MKKLLTSLFIALIAISAKADYTNLYMACDFSGITDIPSGYSCTLFATGLDVSPWGHAQTVNAGTLYGEMTCYHTDGFAEEANILFGLYIHDEGQNNGTKTDYSYLALDNNAFPDSQDLEPMGGPLWIAGYTVTFTGSYLYPAAITMTVQ